MFFQPNGMTSFYSTALPGHSGMSYTVICSSYIIFAKKEKYESKIFSPKYPALKAAISFIAFDIYIVPHCFLSIHIYQITNMNFSFQSFFIMLQTNV